MDEIDWFLTDPRETPDGFERFYSERLARLPDGYVCYSPPSYAPDVAPLPALWKKHITFGCFNNLAKITPRTLSSWAAVLRAVPGSHFVLKCHQMNDAATRDALLAAFSENGIDKHRIDLRGGSPHRALLQQYGDVDIVLDPFPYTGGLTTCEALWMGVPVVTMPGEIFASRHSTSHLANVGLHDWIASDHAEYEAIAIARASDVHALAELRANLRSQMKVSPLCDAPRFGRNLGVALRGTWRDWCSRAILRHAA
jgi:predicted O-linked N-acetylglucosamine transferase (SPINDLY family)